jgi:hypothetical protein
MAYQGTEDAGWSRIMLPFHTHLDTDMQGVVSDCWVSFSLAERRLKAGGSLDWLPHGYLQVCGSEWLRAHLFVICQAALRGFQTRVAAAFLFDQVEFHSAGLLYRREDILPGRHLRQQNASLLFSAAAPGQSFK